jgi:osmotically-inducible protein OsmY
MIVNASQRVSSPATGQDGQIRAAVVDALESMPYAALRRLSCRVTQGTAEIHGTVPTFYLKQLAQAAVSQQRGVLVVRNLVEVRQ